MAKKYISKYSLIARPKNKEFHSSPAQIKAVITGIGFGKTALLVNEIYKYLFIDKEKHDVVAVEPTWKMLFQVMLPELRKWLPSFAIVPSKTGNIIDKDQVINLKPEYGGNKVYLRTGKNYETIRGLNNVGLIALDEASLLEEEVFDISLSRIKRPGITNGRLVAGTTPRGSSNWVERRIVTPAITDSKGIYKVIKAASYENPDFKAEDIEFYRQIYSEARFRQEILGEAVKSDLLIFRDYDPDVHNIAEDKLPKPNEYHEVYVGVDFGLHSTAVLIGILKDVYYVIDIIYLGNRTSDVLGAEITAKWEPAYCIANSIVDSSGGERVQHIPYAVNANKDVEAGLDAVVSLLQHNRIYFNKDMEHFDVFLNEITSYVRDEQTLRPTRKSGNHILDAIRYVVHTTAFFDQPAITYI